MCRRLMAYIESSRAASTEPLGIGSAISSHACMHARTHARTHMAGESTNITKHQIVSLVRLRYDKTGEKLHPRGLVCSFARLDFTVRNILLCGLFVWICDSTDRCLPQGEGRKQANPVSEAMSVCRRGCLLEGAYGLHMLTIQIPITRKKIAEP